MQFEEEKINKNQTNPRHNTNFRKKTENLQEFQLILITNNSFAWNIVSFVHCYFQFAARRELK